VVVLTADQVFETRSLDVWRQRADRLEVIRGRLVALGDSIDVEGATVVVADVDGGDEAELRALERLLRRIGAWPPVVAVTKASMKASPAA